jgi:hypothetical protein
MWGPYAFTGGLNEPYAESPGGQRVVQYFDKSRMEITDPNGDQNSPWYVTNGLLVVELITGQLQTGNASFEQRQPANVNVAGDADDDAGFTYAAFASILDQPPSNPNDPLTGELVVSDGQLSSVPNPAYAAYGIMAAVFVPETQHTVASPFWTFMTSSGIVYENGQFVTAPLFLNAFYATGFPITEANWGKVKVGGTVKDVLIQCFERRCLTYTPSNAPEWQVEAGNVGQHYHAWRYPDDSEPTDGFELTFEPLNASGGEVTGTLAFAETIMTVTIQGRNATPGEEHPIAMHGLRGDGPFYLDPPASCPTPAHDADGDGLIEGDEGQLAYGEALLPMLPSPLAETDGALVYEAQFNAEEIGWDPIGVPALRVIVVYGMMVAGVYEPTIPIACGRITYVESMR